MKLHRYVDHQRLHIVTKDVISLSISVLLLFRHYISHKITFGAPSSGGVLCSACGAFIWLDLILSLFFYCYGCPMISKYGPSLSKAVGPVNPSFLVVKISLFNKKIFILQRVYELHKTESTCRLSIQ